MSNKDVAGAGGAGFGAALAILIMAIFWPDANAQVSQALTVVCSTVVSFGLSWITPHTAGEK